MASSSDVAMVQTMVPVFASENYDIWSIKMSTLLLSQGLRNIVDEGYKTYEDGDVLTQLLQDIFYEFWTIYLKQKVWFMAYSLLIWSRILVKAAFLDNKSGHVFLIVEHGWKHGEQVHPWS
jgi:hypothetical protein